MRWVIFGFVLVTSVALAGITDFSPGLLHYVTIRWGRSAPDRLVDWREEESKHLSKQRGTVPNQAETMTDLEDFNWYWNNIRYYSDMQHWGVVDYWASPVETLASEGADCEDYAIAKYFSLKALGIPVQNLRITYVRALRWNESHMVLAYYPTVDADPYILDNLSKRVSHASERTDLEPVYSFNDDDIWLAGSTVAGGKSTQIRLWQGLLDKLQKERAM
jgi:predicted transglutaminase-like cysteine proteinase